jgi:SAM-dependent methyltransferase
LNIRENKSQLDNTKFVQLGFTNLSSEFLGDTDSVPSLHVFEHFGLGRYNDPIDSNGHLIGFEAVNKILKPGGKFYFSTPIGPQRIEFNTPRVFSIIYLIDIFTTNYTVDSFSYVDDSGALHKKVELSENAISTNLGCTYGCGILELTKN